MRSSALHVCRSRRAVYRLSQTTEQRRISRRRLGAPLAAALTTNTRSAGRRERTRPTVTTTDSTVPAFKSGIHGPDTAGCVSRRGHSTVALTEHDVRTRPAGSVKPRSTFGYLFRRCCFGDSAASTCSPPPPSFLTCDSSRLTSHTRHRRCGFRGAVKYGAKSRPLVYVLLTLGGRGLFCPSH